MWNYSKTPARGVADVAIHVDSNIIHYGAVPASRAGVFSSSKVSKLADMAASPHTILFTSSPDLLQEAKAQVSRGPLPLELFRRMLMFVEGS